MERNWKQSALPILQLVSRRSHSLHSLKRFLPNSMGVWQSTFDLPWWEDMNKASLSDAGFDRKVGPIPLRYPALWQQSYAIKTLVLSAPSYAECPGPRTDDRVRNEGWVRCWDHEGMRGNETRVSGLLSKYKEALEALPLTSAQQGKRFAMQTQQVINKFHVTRLSH